MESNNIKVPQSLLHQPLIQLYQLLIKLYSKNSTELFHQIFETITYSKDQIDKEELKEVCTLLANYSISQINSGNEQFLKHLFDSYSLMIDFGIFYTKNQLSPWKFLNMVTISLRLNEISWTKNFINEHIDHIPEPFRKNAMVYNTANYYYHNKEYAKADSLLQEHKFNDPTYTPSIRSLQMKIYFETEDDYLFKYYVESFLKFIQRNKQLSNYNKEGYLNFIKTASKINKLRTEPLSSKRDLRLNKIVNDINGFDYIQNSTWLLEQVRKLDSGKTVYSNL